MIGKLKWLAAALAAVALWALASSAYVVDGSQQALIIRFGAPMGVAGEPGLKFKVPFSDSVVFFDSNLQTLLSPAEQVILGDQKRIEVETFTRFRISDPLRFYQAVGTLDQANAQLTQMVSSSVRRELGEVALRSLLSPARRDEVAIIEKDVADKARSLGIEVTEVRLHRADLPFEASQAIYDRMKSERQREAKELRAQGFEWAQQIQAKADRDVAVGLGLDLLRPLEALGTQFLGFALALGLHAIVNSLAGFERQIRAVQAHFGDLNPQGPGFVGDVFLDDGHFVPACR